MAVIGSVTLADLAAGDLPDAVRDMVPIADVDIVG
jgi:hypothetical protein